MLPPYDVPFREDTAVNATDVPFRAEDRTDADSAGSCDDRRDVPLRRNRESELPPSQSLARLDALQIYMYEVLRPPLLTPEEDHALAVRSAETPDVEAAA